MGETMNIMDFYKYIKEAQVEMNRHVERSYANSLIISAATIDQIANIYKINGWDCSFRKEEAAIEIEGKENQIVFNF